jgi:hypothetical protein
MSSPPLCVIQTVAGLRAFRGFAVRPTVTRSSESLCRLGHYVGQVAYGPSPARRGSEYSQLKLDVLVDSGDTRVASRVG